MPSPVPAGCSTRCESFVAVQTGCDHRCTFCSIWQARGPSRTLPFEAVRDAIEREIDRGREGDRAHRRRHHRRRRAGSARCASASLPPSPRCKRLRLSSLDSIEIDEALFELIAGEPRLMPHFHLSLQAGDDLILKRMKRRHSRADAVRTVERIKAARPDATIGADLIAGFPTETEDMALNSLKLLDDCDVVAAHIFPFLAAPGHAGRAHAPARRAKWSRPAPRGCAMQRRARRVRWLDSLVGTTLPVLIEIRRQGPQRQFRAGRRSPGAARGETGAAARHRPRRRHLLGMPGHELARPPARRLHQDRRQGRRQSHRPAPARPRSTPRRSTISRRR